MAVLATNKKAATVSLEAAASSTQCVSAAPRPAQYSSSVGWPGLKLSSTRRIMATSERIMARIGTMSASCAHGCGSCAPHRPRGPWIPRCLHGQRRWIINRLHAIGLSRRRRAGIRAPQQPRFRAFQLQRPASPGRCGSPVRPGVPLEWWRVGRMNGCCELGHFDHAALRRVWWRRRRVWSGGRGRRAGRLVREILDPMRPLQEPSGPTLVLLLWRRRR